MVDKLATDAQRLREIAEADCGCRIPSPFDEVAEHLATLAEAEGFKRGQAFRTPANGEQVDRDAIALLREIVAGDGAFFSAPYTIKAEAILARHDGRATPTEDARSRVKVLEEALEKIASECDRMRKGTDDWFDLVEISLTSRTVLGNKETDRHG